MIVVYKNKKKIYFNLECLRNKVKVKKAFNYLLNLSKRNKKIILANQQKLWIQKMRHNKLLYMINNKCNLMKKILK